jgi:hypothetical protein
MILSTDCMIATLGFTAPVGACVSVAKKSKEQSLI